MSSAMRNFMEAYHAVHNPDAKEEFYSKKDELSEMDFSLINQDELDEIAEEALEEMFSEGFTVSEAELVFEDIITEAKVSYGHDTESPRAQKVKAMKSSLKGAIDKVKGKASKGAVKGYQAYRDAKTSAADKARRTAQTAKNMGAQTARKASDAKAKIKSGLKGMIRKAAERVASGASNVAKRMSEGVRDMDPEKGTKERKARLEKKRGMKMDDHPQYKKEEVEQVDEGKSDRPLGVMHHFARGVKQKRGAKKDEGGKYLSMQHTKKQNKKEADADAYRERQRVQTKGTWYREELEQVDENRAAMGRINKEYHRKKEAEAMAARARDPKVKRDLPKRKNDNPMYDPKSAGSSRVKGFKFTGEEVEHIDEDSRRMSNKQHTARIRSNIKSFGSDYTPPSNYDPDANRGKGEVLTRKQIEKKRRKALRQEELDIYDIILSHILDEGYAETPEAAESIMVNMSQEWRDSIVEADSLAAMQARREKRLARQRKQMGTSSTGQDFGHDYGISSAERKKRQQAEFDKFVGKKTQKEELENVEELYKGKHGQSDKEYADSRSQGGKMVSGDSKMSGAEYTHGRRVKAANPGMQPDVGGKTKPKSQGKMDKGTRADLMYRKANMKKSMKEAWADAYRAVYEVDEEAKPDYLDFDKDGNKKESMKKALKDKKKGNPKYGMKGHKCDDDCDHDENGNGGDMGEQFKFSEAELQRIQKIVDSW